MFSIKPLSTANNIISGSIFNHAREPNVSYRLDKRLNTIEYTTARQVLTGQELCIYYGSDDKLWFSIQDANSQHIAPGSPPRQAMENAWEDIAPLTIDESAPEEEDPLDISTVAGSVPGPVLLGRSPMFQRIKMLSAEELEEAEGMPVSTSGYYGFPFWALFSLLLS